MQGQPWKVEKIFDTFELADKKRKNILRNSENVSVKVKRMSTGKFAVKTRTQHVDASAVAREDKQPLSPKKLRQEKKRKNRERRAKKMPS
tara:strand:- start:1338 stop:1607 length:270 start_codon:yes stop_codon:yes gene_type:complete